MSRQRSLEQERAEQAWECVKSVKGNPKEKEYVSLARGAPADIQANGLGQTLAFWRAKGFKKGSPQPGDPHAQLYQHVAGWVQRQIAGGASHDLLEWVTKSATTNDYRRATAEAIAFLTWLKRFAEAELEHEQTATQS